MEDYEAKMKEVVARAWRRGGFWAIERGRQVALEDDWRYPPWGWCRWGEGLTRTERLDFRVQEVWFEEPRASDPLRDAVVEDGRFRELLLELEAISDPVDAGTLPEAVGFTVLAYLDGGSICSLADVVLDTPAEGYFEVAHLTQLVSMSDARAMLEIAESVQHKTIYAHPFALWLVAAIFDYSPDRPGVDAQNLEAFAQRLAQRDVIIGAFDTSPGQVQFAFRDVEHRWMGSAALSDVGVGLEVFGRGEGWRYTWRGCASLVAHLDLIGEVLASLRQSDSFPTIPGFRRRNVCHRAPDEIVGDGVRYMFGDEVYRRFYE